MSPLKSARFIGILYILNGLYGIYFILINVNQSLLFLAQYIIGIFLAIFTGYCLFQGRRMGIYLLGTSSIISITEIIYILLKNGGIPPNDLFEFMWNIFWLLFTIILVYWYYLSRRKFS